MFSLETSNYHLTGTDSVGFVGLKFQEDMKRLVFNVNVENIENITGVYIYHDDKNQNGTVVLDLMEEAKELGNDDENIGTRD